MIIKLLHSAGNYTGNVLYSIDNKGYTSKPKGGEIGAIRNRLAGTAAHTETSIQRLAELMEHGHTFQGARLRDKTSENEDTDTRSTGQQLFGIDIDNDYKGADGKKYKRPDAIETSEQILTISDRAGVTPCIIAESFSSGKADPNGDIIPKFHVYYASDKLIQDIPKQRRIIENLQNIFGAVDEACKDPARIFFGTTPEKSVYVCSAVNSSESLLNCYTPQEQGAALSWDSVINDSESTPAGSERNRRGRYEEADRDILLSMCDPNTDYNTWVKVSAAYKKAGGDLDLWLNWCRGYTGSKSSATEQDRTNRNTWKGLTGKGVTAATLKKYAKEGSPAEYASYIAALSPDPQSRTKTKNRTKAAHDQSGARTTPARADSEAGSPAPAGKLLNIEMSEEPAVIQWLEYPEHLEKPENYVDFAFIDEKGVKHVDTYLLAENVRRTSHYIFIKGANPSEPIRRYWYNHGVYEPINDEYIKNKIRKRLEVFGSSLCKKRYIEEAFYHIAIDSVTHTDSEVNSCESIINFQNGLLHLDTMQLTPHTPELLSTIQIPCKYKTGLTLDDCPIFTNFISRLANYDQDSTITLLEFIGAVISNIDSSRFKKALFLKGAGNCGKSQLFKLLNILLSDSYYATSSLERLESRFGAYSLYNRRLVGDPDIKYMKLAELNTFKQATGGDPLFLEQKGKMQFTYKYNGFLLFGCNDLPMFGGDNGKWVYNRMLLIECGQPVTEQERDPDLINKLDVEREAIVSVCLAELKKAISRKYVFTESKASRALLETYRNENDPVRTFLNECCILRDKCKPLNDGINTKRFYNIYCAWYEETGNRSKPSVQQFRRALTHATDVYKIDDLERKLHGIRYYIYTLNEEARRRYAGDTAIY